MSSDRTQLIDQGTMVYPLDPALAQASEACPHCTSQISPGEQFCPRCGFQRGTWKLAKSAEVKGPASRPAGVSGPAIFILQAADGNRHALPIGDWILGRGEVDLRVDDGFISRSHAKLSVSADAVSVTDLGSSNGSFHEGRRLTGSESITLRSGDRVSFGRTEFVLAAAEPGAETAHQQEAPATDSPGLDEIAPAGSIDPEIPQLDSQPLSGWAIVAESGETIDIPQGGLTIGRKADKAQHVVGDGYVSSLHCRLEAVEAGLQLTDLGSTNGSFVGETRLEANVPVVLGDGDSFRIGQTVFAVQSSEGAATHESLPGTSEDDGDADEVNQDLPV